MALRMNMNLFFSEFVVGGFDDDFLYSSCSECGTKPKSEDLREVLRVIQHEKNFLSCLEKNCPQKKRLNDFLITKVRAVNLWQYFLNHDFSFNTNRSIERICYLHIIPLEDLQKILIDLHSIFKKEYPFSKIEDFKKMVFQETIYDLKDLIKWYESNKIVWLSEPPSEQNFTYYSVYTEFFGEDVIHFGIEQKYDIDYYVHYFKRVLELIDSFNIVEKTEIKEPKPPFTDSKTHELFNYIVDNWKYKAGLKWGYILNFLNSNESYLPLSKYNLKDNYGFKMGVKYRNEYIDFIGKHHDFYKDLQPEKAVSEKQYEELLKLYKAFCEIYV